MPIFTPGSLQLKVSPYLQKEGEMIRCVNVETDFIGAKKKRPGYTTYLGTPDNAEVTTLFNFTRNSGTQFWNYRFSGSVLYYSQQGTGAWTVCGNGTFAGVGTLGYGISANTMLVGNGVNATRHTTNGTSFTDTTAAPIAAYFTDYQNRIYAGGTASSLFWSTAGTPTSWSGVDSSSVDIPGPGRINGVFKANDRVVATKNSGGMYKWDGYSLLDMTTDLGPTSSNSIARIEDYRFFLNRRGIFGFGGGRPELISNPIERQIYNDLGSGMVGTVFDNAAGIVHRYDYLLSVGNTTDDFTNETLTNGILKYDYQLNEWDNWSFNNRPTAWGTYQDVNGDIQLIFGDSGGQCYTVGGTNTTDNGQTISSIMEFIIHAGVPEYDKKWNYLRLFFNPGNQAQVQVAPINTMSRQAKTWYDLGDCSDGVTEFRFPEGSQSKHLFVKIYEASRNSRFNFFGFSYDAKIEERK